MYQTIAGVRCRIQPSVADVHKDARVQQIDMVLDHCHQLSNAVISRLMKTRTHLVELVTEEYRSRA